MPFRLSPQWLCSNSCTWLHDIRLLQSHCGDNWMVYIYIYIYIYMIVKKCAIIFFSIYLYFIIIHLIINNQGSEIKKQHFFAFRNTLLQKLSSCSFFLYIHQKATSNNAKAFLHILVNFFKQLLIMQKLSFTSW